MSHYRHDDELIWTGQNHDALRRAVTRLLPDATLRFDALARTATLTLDGLDMTLRVGASIRHRVEVTT